MITLRATRERALRMVAGADQTARTMRAKAPTFDDFALLRTMSLVDFKPNTTGLHWSELELTAAGREWLGLPTACPACFGTRDKHKRDCPVAMDEQARKIEAEALTTYCTVCGYSLLFIHQTWIGHNGSETCAPGGSRHIAAPNRDAAVARIANKYGVDLSDWIATPEHPDYEHAIACVEICRIQLQQISTDGWGHPYVKAYSIALDVAIKRFLPKA